MDFYLLSVLAFIGILAVVIYRDRKHIEIQYVLFLRRTKIGIKILDKLAKPRIFWKIFGTVGIGLAIFLMGYGIFSLIVYLKLIAAGTVTMPGISLILPSFGPEVEVGPGYIRLPFWPWLIIIVSVILPHETFHGIISRAEKIRVKSAGVLLLLIFPGAFVEPDEKQLKRSKLISKLRVFAAGSVANFLVYAILFYGMSLVIWPYLSPGPIIINQVNATSPAYQAGLRSGMILTEINGKTVRMTYDEYLTGTDYFKGMKPGDRVSLVANGTRFDVVLGTNPENKTLPYLGVAGGPLIRGNGAVANFLLQVLTWVWLISYAVAIFNIMPIYPLDGGLIVHAIAEKINKKYANKITYAITFIMIFILALNVFVPFLLKAVLPPS